MITDSYTITCARESDSEEILALYQTHLYGPAEWNEYYPNQETITFDLSRDALFVMKNEKNEIIAAISIDSDDTVDALPCWSKELQPSGELARLCVRSDMHNQGLARKMMQYAFTVMREQGLKSVHILVKSGHAVALRSYAHLDFKQVGDCQLFGKDFLCFEKEL